MDSSDPNNRFLGNADIWDTVTQLIADPITLCRLSQTDSIRYLFTEPKRKQMKDEKAVLNAIDQLLHFTEINLFFGFTNVSSVDLMTEYLSGFDGDLDYLLAALYFNDCVVNETRLAMSNQVLQIKALLKQYTLNHCTELQPLHATSANLSEIETERFNTFAQLQHECQQLMFALEEKSGDYVFGVRSIIGNFKFMMYGIVIEINYPGIRHRIFPGSQTKGVCREFLTNNRETVDAWKQLVNSPPIEEESTKKFQTLLQRVPGVVEFLEVILQFLDKVENFMDVLEIRCDY